MPALETEKEAKAAGFMQAEANWGMVGPCPQDLRHPLLQRWAGSHVPPRSPLPLHASEMPSCCQALCHSWQPSAGQTHWSDLLIPRMNPFPLCFTVIIFPVSGRVVPSHCFGLCGL